MFYLHKIFQNLNVTVYLHLELWSIKVVKLDVCGSLILSNPVTYSVLKR